ncbi:hypothetical protein [Desulfoscipio sp. XC116]|uniref:hypothetical protein n=1 Tax=Desulfoscipio sp. XC116 TaxID=3144975 RepID=UPI00325AE14B
MAEQRLLLYRAVSHTDDPGADVGAHDRPEFRPPCIEKPEEGYAKDDSKKT